MNRHSSDTVATDAGVFFAYKMTALVTTWYSGWR